MREAFDIVKKHLLCQGKKSRAPNGSCKYRGPDGLKCAVGVLIPDSEYVPGFDNATTLDEVRRRCPSLRGLDYDFLLSVQRLHDNENVETWPEKLDYIERTYVS